VPWELDPLNVGTGLPLEGLRVLDLSRVLAGPLCAMVLGDLGADVVKVEAPSGDPVRALAPPSFGPDATYYLAVNRHRRDVVVDLHDARGAAALDELVGLADVVIENYLPSQAASLGIDRLRARHPDTLWVSVTPATEGGPLADLPSFDLLAQARSGLMGVTGEVGGPPTKVGAPVADVVTGLYAAVGALGALLGRARGARVARVEAPLLECAISALINQSQGYLSSGANPVRLGSDHPSITPYGPVRARDGHLLLAVGTDAQFERLCAVLGDPDLARPEWATNVGRVAARDALRAAIERSVGREDVATWVARLDAARVPCAPILDVAGALAQAQVAQGDLVQTMDAPGGVTAVVASPLRFDGRRPRVRRGPRALGQDTEEILG
jgi:glutaryl-CoA transferase